MWFPLNVGWTLNQAAPARTVGSLPTVTDVVFSPQIVPWMYCVCCIRSSPESMVLVAPFWAAGGGCP